MASTLTTRTQFEGGTLRAWITHFRLEKLGPVLEELGATEVLDLVDVYSDEQILDQINSEIPLLEYKRFIKAVTLTVELEHLVEGNPALAARIARGSTVVRPLRGTEVRALEEVERKADAVRTPSMFSDPAAQIRAAEEELKALEKAERDKARQLKKKVEKTKQRKLDISKLDAVLTSAAALDLAIVLDCTGSMKAYLETCKTSIQELVSNLDRFYPNVPLRIAFVGYRDHCDGENRLSVQRFTSDVAAWTRTVRAQTATGGGDGPEDVMGALNVATTLEWKAPTRVLFHLADAPCHGTQYHKGGANADSYPAGDPHGIIPENIIPGLRARDIIYIFGKLNNTTNKMITEFNRIAGNNYIQTIALSAAGEVMGTITTIVTSALTSTVSRSSRTSDIREEPIPVTLDRTEPRWSLITPEPVLVYSMVFPETLTKLLDGAGGETCLRPIPSRDTWIKVAPAPFGRGALRAAYKARKVRDFYEISIIHKRYLAVNRKYFSREYCEADLCSHQAATFLAREFNRVKPTRCEQIEYVQAEVFQYATRKHYPFGIQEEEVPGTWEKFNNNSGFVEFNPTSMGTRHDAIQAFCHWTHHVTDGKMLVVDCQGSFDRENSKFILTDPAVHCTDALRFGRTNMSGTGIQRFFKTHVCNAICREMLLPPTATASPVA